MGDIRRLAAIQRKMQGIMARNIQGISYGISALALAAIIFFIPRIKEHTSDYFHTGPTSEAPNLPRTTISENVPHHSNRLNRLNRNLPFTNGGANLGSSALALPYTSANTDGRLFRIALPKTVFPERSRLAVITHTVKSGESVIAIAAAYQVSPATVVWSNWEVLGKAPWLISPGLTLLIPPIDGAIHVANGDESLHDIAAKYAAQTKAVVNNYNPLPEWAGDSYMPHEGATLFIPGGQGPAIAWQPRNNTGVIAWELSSGGTASGDGVFALPTRSTMVSGWLFKDARNPQHIGIDYGCSLGAPIVAGDTGNVVAAGWGGGYGNLVIIDHNNGFRTYYGHLDQILVVPGQAVNREQQVGTCGSTGWSTGPHLHYEIRLNGVPQNPRWYE